MDRLEEIKAKLANIKHAHETHPDSQPCPYEDTPYPDMEWLVSEVERLLWSGIHTCSAKCQRPMCVARREIAKAKKDLDQVGINYENLHHDYAQLAGLHANMSVKFQKAKEALEGFSKHCIKPQCKCWACKALKELE